MVPGLQDDVVEPETNDESPLGPVGIESYDEHIALVDDLAVLVLG